MSWCGSINHEATIQRGTTEDAARVSVALYCNPLILLFTGAPVLGAIFWRTQTVMSSMAISNALLEGADLSYQGSFAPR